MCGYNLAATEAAGAPISPVGVACSQNRQGAKRFRICFFLMGQPRPLFRLYLSFQTNITILTTNKWEKALILNLIIPN